jgi:LmbE family N-acetylglucosaminyl deacetylase
MISLTSRALTLALVVCLAPALARAQAVPEKAPPAQHADVRFKVDVLVVVAHPDDESAIAEYIAKAVFDEHRRVAVVYTTSGEGGRNAVGVERGASMGAVRRIEAERALAELGVDLVWWLDGRDTATQNVLLSLSSWPHGAVLEDVVRYIRLTEPEVVMTWMPRAVAGENHGDHQAAGVVATEAFDLAGDPTAFAGQLAPPRLRFPPENLEPWQPKKLYFFTDAFEPSILDGKGPIYDAMAVSTMRHVPLAYIAMKSASHHLSQFSASFPQPVLDAIARDDVATAMRLAAERRNGRLPDPVRLMLAKSLVGGSATGDVFESVAPGPIPFAPRAAVAPEAPRGLALGLDGTWRFYPLFWRAHGLDRVLSLDPMDVSVRPASELRVPMFLRNATGAPVDVTLARASPLPEGWVEQPMSRVYPLGPNETYRVEAVLTTGAEAKAPVALTYEARSGGTVVGTVTLRVIVRTGTMPQ